MILKMFLRLLTLATIKKITKMNIIYNLNNKKASCGKKKDNNFKLKIIKFFKSEKFMA